MTLTKWVVEIESWLTKKQIVTSKSSLSELIEEIANHRNGDAAVYMNFLTKMRRVLVMKEMQVSQK